jgi:hypothetical protein
MASILRHRRRQHFTVLPNLVLRDHRLSFRATGLLGYLLSLRDGTPIDSTSLGEQRPEGRDAIQTAFRELRSAGYVAQRKEQQPNGRWITVTEITDEPETGFQAPDTENPFPEPGKPRPGKPGLGFPGPKSFSTNYEELQRARPENPDDGVAASALTSGDADPGNGTGCDNPGCANGWVYNTAGDVHPCPTCRPQQYCDLTATPAVRRDLE